MNRIPYASFPPRRPKALRWTTPQRRRRMPSADASQRQPSDPHTDATHAMLVYAPGQFFVEHQGSEKDDEMVGTLVVGLPSVFRGVRSRSASRRDRDVSGVEECRVVRGLLQRLPPRGQAGHGGVRHWLTQPICATRRSGSCSATSTWLVAPSRPARDSGVAPERGRPRRRRDLLLGGSRGAPCPAFARQRRLVDRAP
jgi:hypothetical protein